MSVASAISHRLRHVLCSVKVGAKKKSRNYVSFGKVARWGKSLPHNINLGKILCTDKLS